MLSPIFIIVLQSVCNYFQMLFIVNKIGIGGVDKKRLDIVLADIVCVRFLDIKEIIVWDILFVGTITLLNISLQLIYRRMQVDDDLGLDQLLVNDLEQTLVQAKFI